MLAFKKVAWRGPNSAALQNMPSYKKKIPAGLEVDTKSVSDLGFLEAPAKQYQIAL